MRHCAVLCALKLLLMPALYLGLAPLLACSTDPAFLLFLATMPASASVYSLALTKGLSPRVIGPLVPLSMLLSVALVLEPIVPAAAAMHAGRWLRLLLGVLGAGCAAYSLIPTAGAANHRGEDGGRREEALSLEPARPTEAHIGAAVAYSPTTHPTTDHTATLYTV